jgi:hypothetical protein
MCPRCGQHHPVGWALVGTKKWRKGEIRTWVCSTFLEWVHFSFVIVAALACEYQTPDASAFEHELAPVTL